MAVGDEQVLHEVFIFHSSGCTTTTAPLLTVDQVRMLENDNIVASDAKGFADLGIEPTAMEAVLESYLYAYRPYGQYTALSETSENADA